jgi:hypothetical protein
LENVGAWLVRLRKLLGAFFIGLGLAAGAVGVLAWLSEWALGSFVLWLLGAGGLLLFGLGLMLTWPSSPGSTLAGSIALLLSSALFLALFAFKFPFMGPGPLIFAAAVGVVGLLGLGWSAYRRGRRDNS